jgi:basic amino acid/polyamine antiporter, APA family
MILTETITLFCKAYFMSDNLKQHIRTPGAILMGLGSIIETGIFVSIAIATQIAGNGVILAQT